MIPRYSRPDMSAIWEPETRFRIWLEIEAHACDAQAELGVIPKDAARAVWERGDFEISRIDAIEAETKHDVIAFLTNVAEYVGDEARFIHQGMTSSDVLDTCLSVQLTRAADILRDDIQSLLAGPETTGARAQGHAVHRPQPRHSRRAHHLRPQAGRLLRGMAAEPRTARGGAAARSPPAPFREPSAPMPTSIPRSNAMWRISWACEVEPVSTQVIPRDRHAMFFATLGVIAGSVERLATEIRHLQRTEVREVEEFFSAGQKGSSAMPHKRNPILTENLTGLARTVRAAVVPALENVALWHERDISHSSVERMIGPDATITLDFALARLVERRRQAGGLSGRHAAKPRGTARPRILSARASGADPGGNEPGRRVSGRSTQRHEGMGSRATVFSRN